MILNEIRTDDIEHDPFGTCLGWHFPIADLLTDRNPDMVPASWEFRQALGGSDSEDYRYQDLVDWLDYEMVTVDDLVKIGNILSRYVRILHMQGRDY